MLGRRIVAGGALCIALTGCSANVGQSINEPAAASPPGMAEWALPLDDYLFGDMNLVARAVSESYANCLRAKGITIPEIAVDVEALRDRPTSVTNVHQRRLFSVAIAREHGYRYAAFDELPDPQPSPEVPAADSSSVARSCADEAASQFEELSLTPLHYSLAAEAYFGAKADEAVLEAARRWRDCLQRQTEIVLPDDPEAMPTGPIEVQLGIAAPDHARRATEREIEFAVADALCREESTYTATFYRAEHRLSAEALAGNRAVLEAELRRHRTLIDLAVATLTDDTRPSADPVLRRPDEQAGGR
ncbi:hypothetical protein [Cellulomonas sp. C5510]|uniref:hypothetical protein n=1 Tax=Cellulomonas sp. C5510 TaxID=2871170 RepID=UPI001C95305A|nr:hypothetical protein [Cellulomonas sp. C5510]QZN84620.1 hypothetical protein K5O09_12300 [Cellulomonas sp. C5510]